MKSKPNASAADGLRRRAEARLRAGPKRRRTAVLDPMSAADAPRLLHELQVHQVELELQNAELQEARDRMEVVLEKYTDLYDFAPVGYFSLDAEGRILEVNLTGAALLRVERSGLIARRFLRFVARASQPGFTAFLEQVFAGPEPQVCEAILQNAVGTEFWANFHAVSAPASGETRTWCRVAVSNITALKRAEAAQRRMDALTATNRALEQEIGRRLEVEASLTESEQHQSRLLAESHRMQEQLRHLSRQVLRAQEEERKRISRELHDVIAQMLTGINVQLATLKREARITTRGFINNIARTQRLVEQSVAIVHRFARELRPAVLDDLGLVPALRSHLTDFAKQTGLRVSLSTFTSGKIANLDSARRTALYRVAQEALSNIARHAQASRVEASLLKGPHALCLQIKDDGRAFEVERMMHARKSKRLGLVGMRERMEMVGGRFTVESVPGQGTTIQAQIPFDSSRRAGGGGGRKVGS